MQISQNYKTNSSDTDYRIRYDYYTYYTELFKRPLFERSYPYFKCMCPFHNDKNTPNLDINIITGFMKCYACGKTTGAYEFMTNVGANKIEFNIPKVLEAGQKLDKVKKYQQYKKQKELTELDLRIEENRSVFAHIMLVAVPLALEQLLARGITKDSINKWRIGFGHGVYSFPIYDKHNKMASLKFHKKFQTTGAQNQLYPWNAVLGNKDSYVIIVEGEFDMIILRQYGFNAVTQTAGANSWNHKFAKYFKNKIVYVAYDNDQPGQSGAIEVANYIVKDNSQVYIVPWLKIMEKGEDHLDFFIKYKKSAENYKTLLSQARKV